MEDSLFTTKLTGEQVGPSWNFSEWDDEDWPFTSAARDTPDELYALWEGAVERSRARLAAALTDGGLYQLAHVSTPDGRLIPSTTCATARHRSLGAAPPSFVHPDGSTRDTPERPGASGR